MQLRNSLLRYGAVPMALHWATVALVVLAWLLGTFGDALPSGAARAGGLFVHMSAGLTILFLLVLRIPWRLFDRPPPLEATPLGGWLGIAAKLTHLGLYALLIATPLFGVVLEFARGNALPFYGITEIASPWVRDRAFASSVKEIHSTLADALVILAGFHAAAALAHHWILRDGTLARMLPSLGR